MRYSWENTIFFTPSPLLLKLTTWSHPIPLISSYWRKWKKKKESTTTIFFKLYLFTYLFFILSYCPPLSISFSFFFFLVSERMGLINISWQSVAWLDGPTRKDGRGGGQKGGLKKEGKIKKERETYKKRKYGGERNGRKPNPTVFSWTCCLAEKEMNEWLQRHLSSIRKVWC